VIQQAALSPSGPRARGARTAEARGRARRPKSAMNPRRVLLEVHYLMIRPMQKGEVHADVGSDAADADGEGELVVGAAV